MALLLEISSTTIPDTLAERSHSYTPVLGLVLFVGFVLIAVARLSRQNLYRNLFLSWFKVTGLHAFLKEGLPLDTRGSVFLVINYLLSGSVLVYLKLAEFEIEETVRLIAALLLPLSFLLLTPIGVLFTAFVTGEYSKIRDLISMKIIGAQILGLIFFVISLLWMLNIELIPQLWLFIVILIIVESLARIFKSVQFVTAEGVSWYYIILYLCTLEILPLFVAYLLVMKNFS